MILVTGGLGFIGSHTVVALQENGYEVVIVDDLSNSSIDVIDGIEASSGIRPLFEEMNLQNSIALSSLFQKHKIKGIIHFAAFKAVGESIQKPVAYYQNNLGSLLNLLAEVEKATSPILLFSNYPVLWRQELPITE